MVVAMDLQRRYIWLAVLGLVLNVALNLALIPKYGIEAAAWVTLGTEIVVVALSTAMVLRRIEMRLSLRRLTLALVSATVAALAVYGLREAGAGAIVLILAMAVLYPLLLIASRALDIGQLKRLVRTRGEAAA
jgi:O-antigen/teichoic acid export membrane protein